MNQMIHNIFLVLQSLGLVLIGWQVFYLFFFALAGKFYRTKLPVKNPAIRKIAILIPGYREDAVIIQVAKEALLQKYPSETFEVVIIADSFQSETMSVLKTLPLRVIEVVFEKSTKAKALNKAMQELDASFELVVILDADNIMEKDFLQKINTAFDDKCQVVQGHRKAANTGNTLSILDALSEEINNHIFRKGHRAAGLSAAIIGSGMAFRFDLFRKMISEATAVGGFDKELELKLLKNGHTIQYLDDAVVYDEKVSQEKDFTNQRRRWLSAQVFYFRRDFLSALRYFFTKGNIDYLDKVIQFMLLPRILLLGAVIITSVSFILLNLLLGGFTVFSIAWMTITAFYLCVFLLSVPFSFYTRDTLKAIAGIPRGMWLMLVSLTRIRGANQSFIHTTHGEAIKTKT